MPEEALNEFGCHMQFLWNEFQLDKFGEKTRNGESSGNCIEMNLRKRNRPQPQNHTSPSSSKAWLDSF